MHKVAGARQAMEAVGAKVLYLSPYSPDLNPTKMALTEPKALVSSAIGESDGAR
jgi:transposase